MIDKTVELNEEKYKKTVSNNVNYEEDIEPYKLVLLISGVGSGKNHWSENVLMKDKRVLLITSRKAKVEERVEQAGLSKCLRISHLEENALLESLTTNKINQSCICSNSQIEWYMKNVFFTEDEKTHLWKFFDVIVMDEAHSLATDATYSDAPFYVIEFLKATYQMTELPIVLMTATPKPIFRLITVKDIDKVNYIDLRNVCKNIKPKRIAVSNRDGCINDIITHYNHNKFDDYKIIYFVNRVKTMYDLIIPALTEAGVPEDIISISYSDVYDTELNNKKDDDRDTHFSKTILENKLLTETYLKTKESLPENIKIFITTTKNKEGINIDDASSKWVMYTESHWDDEIMQMYGRVRSGVEWLYVVSDAVQHLSSHPKYDVDYYLSKSSIKAVNNAFNSWCNAKEHISTDRYKNKDIRKVIEKIHNNYPYLRYSTYEDKFIFYLGRKKGKETNAKALNEFNVLLKDIFDCQQSEIDYFWGMPFYYCKEEFLPKNLLFEKFIEQQGIAEGSVIGNDERDSLLKYANELLKTKYKSHNSAFKNLGYETERCSRHSESPEYNLYYIRKII